MGAYGRRFHSFCFDRCGRIILSRRGGLLRGFGCRLGISFRRSLAGRLFPAAIHKAVLDNRGWHVQIIRIAARKLQVIGLHVIRELAALDCVKFADAVHGRPESGRCGLVTRGRQNA